MTASTSSVRCRRATVAALCFITAACPLAAAQGLQKFGTPKGQAALRTFGNPVGEDTLRQQFPRLASAVSSADRLEAAREIQLTDVNGDGVVTQAEWNAAGYQAPDRFRKYDLNRDGIFTLFELYLRWAQSRTGGEQALKAAEDALSQSPSRPHSQRPSTTSSQATPASSRERRLARSRILQILELTSQTMSVYDRNRNKLIEKSEFHGYSQFGDLTKADADKDGAIASSELFTWLSELLAAQPAPEPPDSAPPWFRTADYDGDGQVHLSEFRRHSPDEAFTDFDRFDRNADGFVTAVEATSPLSAEARRFPSTRPAVVEAETETQLELLVTDDLTIGDIDLQLALLKNGDDDIVLTLVAPDGARAELYFDAKAKPWDGGRLFSDTLIDDEAPAITQRLTRSPLNRTFRSQGSTTPDRQGLKSLYGKNARGTWQLHIRNPSQIAGLLEGWALVIKPAPPAPPPSPTD